MPFHIVPDSPTSARRHPPVQAPFPLHALLATVFALVLALPAALARADVDVHVVRMLHVGSEGRFVFEPSVLRIAAGERVHFVATAKGHNTQSITGMTPDGGPTWRGGLGRDVEIAFDVEGVYGYKCRAHYGMGMVGLIVVGDDPSNLDAARAHMHPSGAHKAFEKLFTELDAGD